MTQVLDEFEMLLEESFAKSNNVADIVEGTVIKKESEGYLVSVKGAKMEAFLSNRELSSDVEELEIGDTREFYVLKEENNEDPMQLSLKRIAFAQAWAQLNDAKIQGDTILAKVVSTVKGGVLVDVADLKGFIPSSQLRTGTPFEGLIDQKIEEQKKQNELERLKTEQALITSKGLTKEILYKQFIDKWDGKTPLYGVIPEFLKMTN